MTCREVIDLLMDYRSGDLAPDERAYFEAHLGWCSRCVVYLRSYDWTVRFAKSAFLHPNDTVSSIPGERVQAILAARQRGRH